MPTLSIHITYDENSNFVITDTDSGDTLTIGDDLEGHIASIDLELNLPEPGRSAIATIPAEARGAVEVKVFK